jgi:hypothetical protein
MKKPSSRANKVVRLSADDIPDSTPEELQRLKAAMDHPVDTSDIPETTKLGPRVMRDASGKLQRKQVGPICKAILSALGRRRMTRYGLWKKASALCPKLSQSAVYEYLRGERDIGVVYAEALMAAVGLKVVS